MLAQLEPIAQRLGQNRHLLDEYIKPLSDEQLRQSPREGQYSGREVLAHLAGADRGMTRLVQLMAAGQEPRLKADYNNDYYNARQQEKRAGLSVEQLVAEIDEAHRDLLGVMDTLRPEDLAKHGDHPVLGDATVLQVLEILASHEKEHIQEFGAWSREMFTAKS